MQIPQPETFCAIMHFWLLLYPAQTAFRYRASFRANIAMIFACLMTSFSKDVHLASIVKIKLS